MDERNKEVAHHIIAYMYFLTIIALQAVILYRQFALQQSIYEFEDFAVILVINSVFLIAALLYFGAIPIRKLSISSVLLFYGAIILLGSLFTYAKYNIFQDAGLTVAEMLDKLLIIFSISGLLVFFWVVLSLLGKRRLEKEISD